MAQRIVALLLVAGWQLQVAVPPHFHAGMSATDMIAHGQRRHIHLHRPHGSQADQGDAHRNGRHGHAHDGHDRGRLHGQLARNDDPLADAMGPLCRHDEDAIYLGTGAAADVAKDSPGVAPLEVVVLTAFCGTATRSLEQHTSAPPRYGGQAPASIATTRLLL